MNENEKEKNEKEHQIVPIRKKKKRDKVKLSEKDPKNNSKLLYFHSLGFKSLFSKSIQHLEDEHIVYLAGQHVAQFNYEKRTHKFILKSSKTKEIFCCSVSKNGKYIALGERLSETGNAQVSVYLFESATRVRNLPFKNFVSIVSLDFSKDSKYLAVATSEPEPSVHLWYLEKSRRLAKKEVKTQIKEVSINPFANWQLASLGSEEMKIWRFSEGELKHFSPVPTSKYTFTCHVWFDEDKLLVGTEEGHILIIEGNTVAKTITNVHPNNASIESISAIERGFCCAGENGFFSVFERTYDSEYFSHYKKFQTIECERIIGLCVSKKEEHVICAYENNSLAHFSLSNVDILKENENNFTLLPIGFHGDLINGIDISIQKSLIVSCSSDGTVRIWNYIKREVELSKKFSEDIHSVTIHPSGTHIIIGFSYKLGMFAILADDLYPVSEFPIKACSVVKYSKGGNRFAAVVTNTIVIFSTMTFEPLMNLIGHIGKIKSIKWSEDDLYMASTGYDGGILEWNLQSKKKKISEYVVKRCSFHSVIYDDENFLLSSIGNDKNIWTVQKGELISRVSSDYDLTSIVLAKNSKTLFVGTSCGKILIYKWPIVSNYYREYAIHHGSITKLILSHEERFLFTIGTDGCLFMLEVESTVDGAILSKKQFNFTLFDDTTYTLKSTLSDKDNQSRELREKIIQIKTDSDRKIQQEYEKHTKMLKDQKEHFNYEIKKLNNQIESLKQTINENETASRDKIAQMEKAHVKAYEEIENSYEKILQIQKKKFDDKDQENVKKICNLQDKIEKKKKKYQKKLDELKAEHDKKESAYEEKIQGLKNTFQYFDKMYKNQITIDEETYQKDIESLKSELAQKIENQEEKIVSSKAEIAIFKNNVEEKTLKMEDLKSKIKQLKNDVKKERSQTTGKVKEIESLKGKITNLEETVSNLKKTNNKLTKKTVELEKLRYVLTFKYKKIREEISPKEELINEMRLKLRGVDKELHQMNAIHDNLGAQINNRNEKIDILKEEIKKYKKDIEEKSKIFSSLVRELSDLSEKGDLKLTNHHLKKIQTKYSNILVKPITSEESKDKFQEFERQRRYIENQMKDFKKALKMKERHTKEDIVRKTNENSLLVSEINTLRRDKKRMQKKINSFETQLRFLQNQNNELSQPNSISTISHINKRPSTTQTRTSRISRISTTSTNRFKKIRTPDSFFSSPSSIANKRQGRLIKGGTRSQNQSSLERSKVNDVLDMMDKNTAKYEQQQKEIIRLKNYVQQLLNNAQNPQNSQNSQNLHILQNLQNPQIPPNININPTLQKSQSTSILDQQLNNDIKSKLLKQSAVRKSSNHQFLPSFRSKTSQLNPTSVNSPLKISQQSSKRPISQQTDHFYHHHHIPIQLNNNNQDKKNLKKPSTASFLNRRKFGKKILRK